VQIFEFIGSANLQSTVLNKGSGKRMQQVAMQNKWINGPDDEEDDDIDDDSGVYPSKVDPTERDENGFTSDPYDL